MGQFINVAWLKPIPDTDYAVSSRSLIMEIERWELYLSHICEPPQLRPDGGTLKSLIGALRSLTHEQKKNAHSAR